MSGGFFRGTSAAQDTRFSNKQAKLLKSQKFAPELEHLVDMTKVKMDVMRPWIANRVTELIGFEDEVLINFIYGLLDGKEVNGKEVQISLTGFMERNTGKFMKELWVLLLSAQSNASGVPQQFLDAKEEETKKKQAESDRLANEIQRRKEKESRELEEEGSAKMDRGKNLKDVASGAPSSKHELRPSAARLIEEKDFKDKHGSRGRSRARRSWSTSKSISDSDERRRSRSPSTPTKRRGCSSSSEKDHSFSPRRSITPCGRHAPRRSRSPSRRSTYSRRRSSSRLGRRTPSPTRYRMRHRSRSPLRRRSRSPYWRRPRSPHRRSSPWNRSRSPIQRRSPSPIRRKSPSPGRRSSPSPLRRKYRGLPSLRHSSQSPAHHRSRSPIRRRSPSPVRRTLRSPIRRRSPSPVQRKTVSPIRDMAPSPVRDKSKSPSGSWSYRRSSRLANPKSRDSSSASPVKRRSLSPVGRKSPKRQERSPSQSRRKSPKRQERSPSQSPRGRIRGLERRFPVDDAFTRNVVDSPTDIHQRSNSIERQSDTVNQKDSRRKLKRQTPSPHRSSYASEKNLIEKRKSTEMKYNSSAKPSSPDKLKHSQTKGSEGVSSERGNKSEKLEHQKKRDRHDSLNKDVLLSEKKRESPIKGRNREEKNLSHAVDTRINDRHLESLPELSGKGKQDDWIPSASSDSELEEINKNGAKVEEKRKSKRSKRRESGSDDESSSDFYSDERKKAKRRRKEEKNLRKEENRKRREERRRRKEEKRSRRQKMKSGGTVSTLSDTDEKRDDDFDDVREVNRRESGRDDVEEPLNEQKKLEIELREKAIELYMAKKGISH